MEKQTRPVHPGKILLHEFLEPLGISQAKLALFLNVPPRRINQIVLGRRRISADTALRLGLCLNTSPQFWLGLQSDYDVCIAQNRLKGEVRRDVLTCSP